MVNEFEFFHGAVICKLIHEKSISSIISYPTESNSSYIINKGVGLFIKYSSKRLSPWRFTFKKEHQGEIQDMKDILGNVYIVFVCNDDGVVCLSFDELKIILDQEHEEVEWVAIHRGRREKYSVSGSDGKLKLKVNVSDFSKITDSADSLEV